MAATKRDKALEWLRWGLTALVIPLAVWGIQIETDNAVQDERITELQTFKAEHKAEHKKIYKRIGALERTLGVQAEKLRRLKEDLAEAKGMKKAIEQNTLTLVALKAKIDGTNNTLEEIKNILRQP